MRCFNHAEVRAVGLCKSCAKGICHDCLTDLGDGLACKAKCEEKVTALMAYNEAAIAQGLKSLKYFQKNSSGGSFLIMAFGVICVVLGMFYLLTKGLTVFSLFYLPLGTILLIHGWRLRRALK